VKWVYALVLLLVGGVGVSEAVQQTHDCGTGGMLVINSFNVTHQQVVVINGTSDEVAAGLAAGYPYTGYRFAFFSVWESGRDVVVRGVSGTVGLDDFGSTESGHAILGYWVNVSCAKDFDVPMLRAWGMVFAGIVCGSFIAYAFAKAAANN
jgi:hypothetical protein